MAHRSSKIAALRAANGNFSIGEPVQRVYNFGAQASRRAAFVATKIGIFGTILCGAAAVGLFAATAGPALFPAPRPEIIGLGAVLLEHEQD